MKPNGPFDLFVSHRAALVDYATPLVGDRSRAEDIVQEAFIRFAPAAETIASTEQPVAYLFRIVRNLAFDWRRRRSLETRHRLGEPEWWMVPQSALTPEQQLITAERLRRFENALQALELNARVAFEMHRFGGFTLAQIGTHLGLSTASVHRLVSKALAGIAAALDDSDAD
ncbi:sigma-70 family RNA polymerase sigma factor [Ferrovibrio sp.]|uniref:sigma-70 family RNA polymerase sigma factor n=1 Tax=Ferrovibrio sp. TaxID=1917215 RepID=UPI0035196A73